MITNLFHRISNANQLLKTPSKLKGIFDSIAKKTWQEISETGNMMEVLWKLSLAMPVTDEEKKQAYEQAKDLAKSIPAFGVFLLPGGAILLPVIAKIVPWNILPSAFAKDKDPKKNDENLESEESTSPLNKN